MTARELGASSIEILKASKPISPSAIAVIENARHLLRRWPTEFSRSAQLELMTGLEAWRQGCSEPHYNDADHLTAAFLSKSPCLAVLVERLGEHYPAAKPFPALCALLALDAAEREDWLTVGFVAAPIMEAVKLSLNRMGKVGGDAMTRILTAYLRRHRYASNAELFEHLQTLARSGHSDFDDGENVENGGTVEYWPRPGSKALKAVDRNVLAKRAHQVRSRLGINRSAATD